MIPGWPTIKVKHKLTDYLPSWRFDVLMFRVHGVVCLSGSVQVVVNDGGGWMTTGRKQGRTYKINTQFELFKSILLLLCILLPPPFPFLPFDWLLTRTFQRVHRDSWFSPVCHLSPSWRAPRGRQELARARYQPAAEEQCGERKNRKHSAADEHAPKHCRQAPDHIWGLSFNGGVQLGHHRDRLSVRDAMRQF